MYKELPIDQDSDRLRKYLESLKLDEIIRDPYIQGLAHILAHPIGLYYTLDKVPAVVQPTHIHYRAEDRSNAIYVTSRLERTGVYSSIRFGKFTVVRFVAGFVNEPPKRSTLWLTEGDDNPENKKVDIEPIQSLFGYVTAARLDVGCTDLQAVFESCNWHNITRGGYNRGILSDIAHRVRVKPHEATEWLKKYQSDEEGWAAQYSQAAPPIE